MRRAASSILLALGLGLGLAVPAVAHAQACHGTPAEDPPADPAIAPAAAPAPPRDSGAEALAPQGPAMPQAVAAPRVPSAARPRPRIGLRLALSLVAASYRTARYEGTYQGLLLALSYRHRRFGLSAALPGYHLVRNGATGYGIGDVRAAVDVSILRRGGVTAGIYLGASLPSGSAAADLGMGHVMLMPSLFVTLRHGALGATLAAGYGAALGEGGAHHHGGGAAPLVDPMNAREWEAMLQGSYDAATWLRLSGGLRGALPAPLPGEARLVASIGARVLLAGFEVAAEGEVPLWGTPFEARGTLGVAVPF